MKKKIQICDEVIGLDSSVYQVGGVIELSRGKNLGLAIVRGPLTKGRRETLGFWPIQASSEGWRIRESMSPPFEEVEQKYFINHGINVPIIFFNPKTGEAVCVETELSGSERDLVSTISAILINPFKGRKCVFSSDQKWESGQRFPGVRKLMKIGQEWVEAPRPVFS